MGAVNFLSQGGLLYNLIKLIHCCFGRSGETSSQTSPNDARRRPSSVSVSCTMPGLQVSWTTIVVLFVLKKKNIQSDHLRNNVGALLTWLSCQTLLSWQLNPKPGLRSSRFRIFRNNLFFITFILLSRYHLFHCAQVGPHLGTWVPMGTIIRF